MGTPNKNYSWPTVQKIFCTKIVCKQFICVLCPLALWKCVVMVLQFKPYLLCYIMHCVSVGACIFAYSVNFPV